MVGEVLAVFEIEFLLPALLDAARGGIVVRRCVAEDCGAELFVGQGSGGIASSRSMRLCDVNDADNACRFQAFTR